MWPSSSAWVGVLLFSPDLSTCYSVVIGDVAARNALIGRNVVFFNVALNSHMLSSFTAAFALVALFADEVGERLGSDDVDVRKRIEDINDCFETLGELGD